MIQAHDMLGEAIARLHYPQLDRDGDLVERWANSREFADDTPVSRWFSRSPLTQ